jgi:hypothetical protein
MVRAGEWQVRACESLLVYLHGQDSSIKEVMVVGPALHEDCRIPYKCAACGHVPEVPVPEKFGADTGGQKNQYIISKHIKDCKLFVQGVYP